MIYLFATFYMSLTWLASKSFRFIIEDVQSFDVNLTFTAGLRIRRWWQCYSSVRHFVSEIGAFFGPYLLLFIATWFALFSIATFMVIEKIRDDDKFRSFFVLIYLILIITILGVIISATQRMKKEVKYFSRTFQLAPFQAQVQSCSTDTTLSNCNLYNNG